MTERFVLIGDLIIDTITGIIENIHDLVPEQAVEEVYDVDMPF